MRWAAALIVVMTLGSCSDTPEVEPVPDAASSPAEAALSSEDLRASSSPSPSPERPCERYTRIGRVRGRAATAFQRPGGTARAIARFPAVNAQGSDQVFPLVEQTIVGEDTWYRALLPIRPNGSTGWILSADLDLLRSDYRLEIDLSRFRLRVQRLCETIATYRIGIGTQDTPTPRGTFFLNSLQRPPKGSVYGDYAYGLSGYSRVIRDWEGGGIIGIHGTDDPSSIGRRVSHGCIRLRNEDIRRLASTLPLGAMVTIA